MAAILFFVAMTTGGDIEHMIVLLLYEIHVIRNVQISNILEMKFTAAILMYSPPW